MKISFEYGNGTLEADLPDERTDVFVPGETVKDPPPLADPISATKQAILNPLGMPPLSKSLKAGDRVCIVFPDRVKGGTHPTAHRKVSIPLVLDELIQAGIERKDITLICSNGLHRKNRPDEIRSIVGDKVYDDFSRLNNIINHDSEDWDNLVDLGYDGDNNRVIMNRRVYEADHAILIGHTVGNPYGGYSGGYKHCATGIVHWRTISTNHNPRVMHGEDFTPVNDKSTMRSKFNSIGEHMETKMGKKFFSIDAVLDTFGRQIYVAAGDTSLVQKATWPV
ncbi:MAG TPA: lactate racemase domain-containing protein, partial [Spirochaetia bacterium]|nr:lactate racemase domain-containing protein [Spirochaetia bacterium]